LVLTGPEEPIVSLIRTPVVPGVPAVPAAVLEPGRLDAVRRTGLVGSPADGAFDDLVRLGRALTGARHVAFTVVDAHRSYVKSVAGDGLRSGRTIPVVHHARPLRAGDRRRRGPRRRRWRRRRTGRTMDDTAVLAIRAVGPTATP
jgi:hypothetical protein